MLWEHKVCLSAFHYPCPNNDMQNTQVLNNNGAPSCLILAAEVIHLTELAKRVKTSEEAAMALDVAQQYVLRRANRQQHDGISPQTSYLILKVRYLPEFCCFPVSHSWAGQHSQSSL